MPLVSIQTQCLCPLLMGVMGSTISSSGSELSIFSIAHFTLEPSPCCSKEFCPWRGCHDKIQHLLVCLQPQQGPASTSSGWGWGKGRREKGNHLVSSLSALTERDLFITKIKFTPFPCSEKTDDISPLAGGASEKILIHVLTGKFTGAVAHALSKV